ncbi:hypothetical protein Tco_0472863 [Tanacetum coccineum]
MEDSHHTPLERAWCIALAKRHAVISKRSVWAGECGLFLIFRIDWYVVPTDRVKVPVGRYVVPTGKDNGIVSAGRAKVIPAGRTILVLVVLCLLRVDSIV